MIYYNGYPDDYASALFVARAREALAPLADVCNDCGAEVEREAHDAACLSAWLDDMGVEYTDDTTDLPDRYNNER